MAHLQNTYTAGVKSTDEYGNPIPRSDDYATTGTTGYAEHANLPGMTTGPTVAAGGTGDYGHHQKQEHHGLSGMLHRSGSSSSSSSSEDDGHGGRRKKKGLKEKVKEKLTGTGVGHHGHGDEHATSTTTPGGYGAHHEKKGIVEKIKEKLPGGHHH